MSNPNSWNVAHMRRVNSRNRAPGKRYEPKAVYTTETDAEARRRVQAENWPVDDLGRPRGYPTYSCRWHDDKSLGHSAPEHWHIGPALNENGRTT